MKNKEMCGLCRKYINTKKDNFVHLIDYKSGKFLGRFIAEDLDKKITVLRERS